MFVYANNLISHILLFGNETSTPLKKVGADHFMPSEIMLFGVTTYVHTIKI